MPDFLQQRQAIIDKTAAYGAPAVLRRREGDRPCLIFQSNFTPLEMLGRTVEPQTRKVLIAATPEVLNTPPDFDQDHLVTFVQPPTNPPTELENLRITEPATPISPNGQVTFWRLVVRR